MRAALVVLDHADDVLNSTGREDLHTLAAELQEVRIALASFIEAAKEDVRLSEESGIDCSSLRSAIARIGGAA